jgi:hypothetical protein
MNTEKNLLAPLPTNRHQRIVGWVNQRSVPAAKRDRSRSRRVGVRVPDMCWTDAARFEADQRHLRPRSACLTGQHDKMAA